MFDSVAPILSQADLAVCHVESPMSPNNANLSYFPAFLVPRELADAIAYAGYDTCSLASNHATDAGRDGIVGTIGALDRVQVAHAGMALTPEARDKVTLIEAGDATVAHLSYTYGFTNRSSIPTSRTSPTSSTRRPSSTRPSGHGPRAQTS